MPARPMEVTLAVTGMSCGACAARLERVLERLEGVSAQVNYASERVTAQIPTGMTMQQILDAVTAAGFTAEPVSGAASIAGAAGTAGAAGAAGTAGAAGAAGTAGAAGAPSAEGALTARLRSLRRRLLLAAVVFMPLCDYSNAFSAHPATRVPGWQWLMLGLALPAVTWGAWPFYAAAVKAARHRTTTMDTLVSLGILAATAWSTYSMFVLDTGRHVGGGIYLDAPAGVIAFLLAGRYFETWSRRRAGAALQDLASLGANDVLILDERGGERRCPVADLSAGERFVVRRGETVAADGEVVLGHSALDQSAMTGESAPVEASPGDQVLGGTISLTGRLVVRATRVGADAKLGQMLRLLERAQGEKAAAQRLADRIAGVFVPAVLALAAGTLATWLLTGASPDHAVNAALSVLVIACPCALGLATPAALFAASLAGARQGIFFRGHPSLEASRHVDTVVFDKTGTLTEGRLELTNMVLAPGFEAGDVLRWAGALEHASEHPLARAVVIAAHEHGQELPEAEDFLPLPGLGVHGRVEGQEIYVGRGTPPREWAELGRTTVVVRCDGTQAASLAFADRVRPSAAAAVERLHGLGLRCLLLTGDSEATAHTVATALGIDEVVAGALPTDKVEVIHRLQAEGRRVAMVGDGVNDAPALAAADLGLAIGSGTDLACAAADLIVARDDLMAVPAAVTLARRALNTIRANLAWAFLYNVLALPLAAAGLLNPLIAGAAMALSSTFVVAASARLLYAGRSKRSFGLALRAQLALPSSSMASR